MKQTSLTELCNVLEKAGFAARLEGEDRQVSAVNSLEDAVEAIAHGFDTQLRRDFEPVGFDEDTYRWAGAS